MALEAGRVGVKPDQVDEYGRLILTDGLLQEIIEKVPPSGWTSTGIANRTEPNGDVVLDSSVVSLGLYLFYNCKGILSLTAPEVIDLQDNCCAGCTSLTLVDMPKITNLSTRAFANCDLREAVFTEVLIADQYVFNNNKNLRLIKLPKLNSVPYYGHIFELNNGSSRRCTVILNSLIRSSSDLFRGVSEYYDKMDFPVLNYIGIRCFYQGHYYDVILRSNTVVELSSTNGVGVGASYGFGSYTNVYVPSALISEYEASTNWASAKATKNFTFVAIEGSQYENYYADGTPIE